MNEPSKCPTANCHQIILLCNQLFLSVPDVHLHFTDFFPPPDTVEERGLARPVVAGIVATICFLAVAVLFSTMAACFVNKQRRRKLKRKRGEGTVMAVTGIIFKELLN